MRRTPPAHRRRRLPVHALRQGRLARRSVLWSPCVGVVWSGSWAPRPSCCRPCWPVAHRAWPPIRRYATDSGAGPRGSRRPTKTRRAARRRSRHPRTTCPGATARRGCSATPPCTPLPGVTLDCASYDADLDPINGADRHRSASGVVRARSAQTPRGRRPAGDDHRFRPAVVDRSCRSGCRAPAPTCSRRAPDRRGRPPRHRHVRRHRLPATCSTVRRCSTRRSSSPATTRSPTSARSPRPPPPAAPTPSHPATRPTTTRTPPRTSNGCAAPGTCRRSRCSASATAPRSRWPTRARTPNKVARLVLDSPLPLGIAAEAATEQRVKGEQAALDAFASAVRRHQLPARRRPEGRGRRAAGGRARPATGPAARRSPPSPTRSRTALAYPRGDRATPRPTPGRGGGRGALRRRRPDDRPDHAGRDPAPDRRPVRQPLQRRAEPAHARPGPRTRRRLGQALPAVRRRRRARPGQVPALAERISAAGCRRT